MCMDIMTLMDMGYTEECSAFGQSAPMSMSRGPGRRGYNVGPIDGIYGPMTMQAVIDFQRDNGLVPDGIVGPMTWAAIDEIYP